MKKIFIVLIATTLLWLGCKKDKVSDNGKDNCKDTSLTVHPKTLIADAGADTTIYMPCDGKGFIFRAVLNGDSSRDLSGKIIFSVWTEINNDSYTVIDTPHALTTTATMDGGIHKFRLEILDDQDNVDYDTVTITIHRKFLVEYDGIPWDSTAGSLAAIHISWKPGLMENIPGLTPSYTSVSDYMNLCVFNGSCNDIKNWETIPYVSYDSINLTNKSLFYSAKYDENIVEGVDYPVIYANSKSGIDFSKKVSIGLQRIK